MCDTLFSMEPTLPVTPSTQIESSPSLCITCHQPLLPQYYFCPNCGTKIHEPPLTTSFNAQIWLYAFSVILPVICFLFVTKWKGLRYLQSTDPKAKTIGATASMLLAVSTVLTFWYAYIYTQKMLEAILQGAGLDAGSF